MYTKKIPVTIIGGFLGAGKTTLVNHLVAQASGERIGIVVNEYGEVGIDGELIVHDREALIEIRNGCICCTVRTDLVTAIGRLLDAGAGIIDRLVIETSGLADPAPVLQTFLADADLRNRVTLESVVTVVDACHLARQVSDPTAREQIAFADLLVLNKCGLADTAALPALEAALRRFNPAATLVRADHAALDASIVFGQPRFSLPALLDIEPAILDEEHDHEHDPSVSSCAVVSDTPLDGTRFNRWIAGLVQDRGADLMRMKAVLYFDGEARRYFFHGVHMLVDARPGPRWAEGEPRGSRMVWIGRGLDPATLRAGFLQCQTNLRVDNMREANK